MIKAYYELTKPGIIYGNALTAAAGFIFASHGAIDWPILGATLLGISCVIASACVFNNYFDRHIDSKMERTKHRGLASGAIPHTYALIFGTALLILGAKILFIFTNLLTLAIALGAFVIYVALYTPLKPRTGLALFVGAFAGAAPPVVGYTAVTNTLDITALWLFLFLFVWQIPHFIAIAYFRYHEYAAAGVPLFMPKSSPTESQRRWGRGVFYASLAVLLVWCVTLMVQR